MRLRFGPHAGHLAEQVVVRDPYYVIQILEAQPDSVLAKVFRELIGAFDDRPLRCACARCTGPADGVCAYPGSIALIGFCDRCVLRSALSHPRPAHRLGGYEDALRHVATSFPRGHRVQMRRIALQLARLKGGPARLTEDAATRFLRSA